MGSISNNKNDGANIAVTDNGNYIVDLFFTAPITDVALAAKELKATVGRCPYFCMPVCATSFLSVDIFTYLSACATSSFTVFLPCTCLIFKLPVYMSIFATEGKSCTKLTRQIYSFLLQISIRYFHHTPLFCLNFCLSHLIHSPPLSSLLPHHRHVTASR